MEQTRTLSSSELKRQPLVIADGFSSRVSGLLGESSREPSRVPLRSHQLHAPDGQGCQYIAIERHSTLEEQSSVQRDPLSYGLSLDMCEMLNSILHFDSLQSCLCWYEISLKAVISYPHAHRIIAIKRHSIVGGQYSVQRDPLSYRLSLDMWAISESFAHFDGVKTARVGKRCSNLVAFSGCIGNQEFFLHFHGLLQASYYRGRVDAGMI